MSALSQSQKDIINDAFGASKSSAFRGQIWENCARFKLVGKAYESMPHEQDGHFCIETARHLVGPLRAWLDPNVRLDFIIGATQVMKSICGDLIVAFDMEHNPRNFLVLFETDQKVKLFCDVRLMDTIKRHPVISLQIQEVDRHDATKTRIKLPTMNLVVGGLNDSNVSSLSWPSIWVSEAWQHKSDGLLKKAIKRADRFPNDCKILIESQAGEAGEDLHMESSAAHQVPLTWACMECGGRQTWEFSQLRPDDFVGRGLNPPKPGTYSGMQFDDGEDISARARSARWECYHCGHIIKDTPANRRALMDTYEQDYQITGPNGVKFSPRAVCFIIPREAALGNTFEDSVKSYLIAKEAEKNGNKTPLANWYMSERAVFWSEKLAQTQVSVITTSASIDNENELARLISIDCQQGKIEQMTGTFWYDARSIDKGPKEIRQLARGFADGWQEWMDVQKKLKIPNSNVLIDGGNYLQEILDKAAASYELVDNDDPKTKRRYPKIISVWKILRGNGTRKSFPHDGHIYRSFSKPSYYQRQVTLPGGKIVTINIPVYEWSNLSVKDHLHNLLMGGPTVPKFTALTREQLPPAVQRKETGDLAYSKQMQNEFRTCVNGKNVWVEATPNVHYRDCACGCIVGFDIGGFMGLPAAMDEAGTAV